MSSMRVLASLFKISMIFASVESRVICIPEENSMHLALYSRLSHFLLQINQRAFATISLPPIKRENFVSKEKTISLNSTGFFAQKAIAASNLPLQYATQDTCGIFITYE